MNLLERDSYRAELNAALADARRGRGRLVLVSGEAGIGKSTLVVHFTRQHERVLRVLSGACDSLFSPRPLGPLDDMLPPAAPRAGRPFHFPRRQAHGAQDAFARGGERNARRSRAGRLRLSPAHRRLFTDEALAGMHTTCYRIAAIDTGGNVSAPTEVLAGRSPDSGR